MSKKSQKQLQARMKSFDEPGEADPKDVMVQVRALSGHTHTHTHTHKHTHTHTHTQVHTLLWDVMKELGTPRRRDVGREGVRNPPITCEECAHLLYHFS